MPAPTRQLCSRSVIRSGNGSPFMNYRPRAPSRRGGIVLGSVFCQSFRSRPVTICGSECERLISKWRGAVKRCDNKLQIMSMQIAIPLNRHGTVSLPASRVLMCNLILVFLSQSTGVV